MVQCGFGFGFGFVAQCGFGFGCGFAKVSESSGFQCGRSLMDALLAMDHLRLRQAAQDAINGYRSAPHSAGVGWWRWSWQIGGEEDQGHEDEEGQADEGQESRQEEVKCEAACVPGDEGHEGRQKRSAEQRCVPAMRCSNDFAPVVRSKSAFRSSAVKEPCIPVPHSSIIEQIYSESLPRPYLLPTVCVL